MTNPKKDILFLHGALGVAEDLRPLINFMEEKNFNPISFNFSGHGKNMTWPDQFRIDHFANDLERFVKANSLQEVPVFGYSMGGYVALYHKINFEDSPLSNIVTYGTKFNWTDTGVSKELPMLDPVYLQEKFPQYTQVLMAKHGDRWRSVLKSTAHMIQNLQKLDGLTKEDLIELNVPVTLIFGDQDRTVTTEETHLTGSWIPHCQVKILTHSKHELERTNLKELANLIEESLI